MPPSQGLKQKEQRDIDTSNTQINGLQEEVGPCLTVTVPTVLMRRDGPDTYHFGRRSRLTSNNFMQR